MCLSVKDDPSHPNHQPDMVGRSKRRSKFTKIKSTIDWIRNKLLPNDTSKKKINAKQSNQLTKVANECKEQYTSDKSNVPDFLESIIPGDAREVSRRMSTYVQEDGHTLSASNESDQSLFVDMSTLTTAPSLSMKSLHDSTDTTISDLGQEDFNEKITDSARNDGVNLQEVKNTNIPWERDDCTTFNISLDISDFEEQELEGIRSENSAWNEKVNLQEVRSTEGSLGYTKPFEETDDHIQFKQVVKENDNVVQRIGNQDNSSVDDCRGETKVEGKLSEIQLDSGLGDSVMTVDIECSSTTMFRSNEADVYGASSIVLEDVSIKCEDETLAHAGKRTTTRQEENILVSHKNKYVDMSSYVNVQLCRTSNNESKWGIYQRRCFTSSGPSPGVGYDHSVQQSLYAKSSPLCEFHLKVRCADGTYGNKSNCGRRNPGLSVSTVKRYDIQGNKGRKKVVPIILHFWQNGSVIRFISPVEYIVLPVSLKTYFNKVTTGILTREEKMAYEWIRYESFHSFPSSSNISASRLANAGFYSTGSGTETKCFCCKVAYDRWSRGDDPYEVHRRISPNCPFLRGEAHNPQNVPIYQRDEQNTSPENESSRHPMQVQHTPSMERTNPPSARCSSALTRDSAVENDKESFKTSGPIPQSSKRTEKKETSNRSHRATQINTAGRQFTGNSYSTRNGAAIPAHVDDNGITQSARPEAPGLPVSTLEDAPLSIAQQPTEDRNTTEHSNPGNFSFRPPLESQEGDVPSDQSPLPSRGPLRTTDHPKHSDYRMLETRIKSFTGWPLHLDQTPQQMAEAGFFHLGVQDYVRCFQCSGGLRNWEPGDNPWVEHARWYPQCAYVCGKKGQRFVDAVTKKQQELLAQQAIQDVIDTSANMSASHSQSASLGSRASRESANLNQGSPGKHSSLNEKVNQNKAAVSRHSDQDRPINLTGNATLSGPTSLGYPVTGNKFGHLNRRTRENFLQREASNVPEMFSLPPLDSQSLKEEYARLRNSAICKVCQQREVVVAFLPCGHLVTCESCAPTLTVCCVCQKKILGSIKTYK